MYAGREVSVKSRLNEEIHDPGYRPEATVVETITRCLDLQIGEAESHY